MSIERPDPLLRVAHLLEFVVQPLRRLRIGCRADDPPPRYRQHWGALDDTSIAEDYLWGLAPGRVHAAEVRQWAELAFWFQSLSMATGRTPITLPIGISENRSMAPFAGDGGFPNFMSHVYPVQRPYFQTHGAFEIFKNWLQR